MFRIWQTTGCKQFKNFRFDPHAIVIGVEKSVLVDEGVNRNTSRLFHNKISVGTYEILSSFITTFNPSLLLQIIGPVGIIIAIFSLQTLFYQKRFLLSVSLSMIFVSAVLTVFILTPKISLYLLSVSWYVYILLSTPFFLRNKLLFFILIFLSIQTFWYFTFNWQMNGFCNEIFFK